MLVLKFGKEEDVMAKVKTTIEVEALDIPSMAALSPEEYRTLVKRNGLFYIDHHGILRSSIADYPLATNREQLDILLDELWEMRQKTDR